MSTKQPTALLWRCEVCSKWSHAVGRPRWHQRWINREDGPPADGAVVISEVEPYGHGYEGHEIVEGGWFVRCGPFEEWRAEKVA